MTDYGRTMRSVLFVTANLEYGGDARQLCLLASGLSRDSFRTRVVVLCRETPWTKALLDAGIEVEILDWRRPFDALPFVALRRLVKSIRPDVLHVWGATALRALVLTGSMPANRLVVSAVKSFAQQASQLDRWLLQRAQRVIAFGAAEAERYRRLGITETRLRIVSPAMPMPSSAVKPAELSGVGADDRVLLGLGPIEQYKGFREAVWTFDILRHLYNDVQLILAGDGTDRPRVEQFTQQIGVGDCVHFPGTCADTAPLLHRADIVWVPSLRGGGICTALEAMAAGRPVVASRLPDLAEIIEDGETGLLVEPNDKVALARQTRLLLDDPQRRQRMGASGRRRVQERFGVNRLIEACARLYAGDMQVV